MHTSASPLEEIGDPFPGLAQLDSRAVCCASQKHDEGQRATLAFGGCEERETAGSQVADPRRYRAQETGAHSLEVPL